MNSISWEKMQVKHKISFFILIILLVSYLFYAFLLLPQWVQRDELKSQYHMERQQVQIVEAFVLAHPNAEQYLIELDQKITNVNMMLPDNPDISRLLLDIEQLSRECGVQLSYLKPGKMTNKEGYREFEVELSVNGNFISVMNFLNKVENGLRFINVTNIGIKMEKDKLESKIMVKIYSYGVPVVPTVNNDKSVGNKK